MNIASKPPLYEAQLPPAALGEDGRPGLATKAVRPKIGTSVLLAHALGPEAVPSELEAAGFELVVATDAPSALDAACAGRVDVSVVDGRFEDDGVGFCERLWAELPGFPVLMIGPNDENLVTRALSAGADDYIVLPLRPAELVARIRAVLRRAPHWATARGAERAVQVGDVRLEPERHEVTLRSERLHLPLREFELLRLLMENVGIVLPRTTLMTRLWGPLAPLDSTSLEVHIRRLRAKLEDDPAAPQRIVTVRGIGYRYQVEH